MKLLIVDDEARTRECIRKLIPWQELGIKDIETAANGIDALNKVQGAGPDILLTDVKMPRMDGIALAERIRELYPSCKIIILSGYSDKEYLKSAIHLNALAYIEKPIKLDEVKTAVLQAASLFRDENQLKASYEDMKKDLRQSMHLIRQEIALSLVKPDEAPESCLQNYSGRIFSSPTYSVLTPACALLNWKQELDGIEKASLRQAVLKSLLNFGTSDFDLYTVGFLENDILVLIASGNVGVSIPVQDNIFEQVLRLLSETSHGKYIPSIGVGLPSGSIEEIPRSFKQACRNADMQFYRGTGKVFYTSPKGQPFNADNRIYPEFGESLQNDDMESARAILDRFTENIRMAEYENIDQIKRCFFNLHLVLFEISLKRGFVEQSAQSGRDHIWEKIYYWPTLYDLHGLLASELDTFSSIVNEINTGNRKTAHIIQYIKKNYADCNLSVQSVSDNINLSLTYMCALFKKTTGKTVNEYITEYRIEKAKDLLKDQNLKLYDISSRVGFPNVQYFSTLFKKYAGISASEFRERYYL